jgi:hypothetical protein
MKLKKGSLEAKKFMAKIRAKKGASKKTHTDIKSHNYKISISGKPSQIDNFNIDNYIALNKKYDETKRYVIQQRQKVKKLKGLEKKLQTFNLNLGINELINFNNQIKSYKKFYKIL